MADRPITTMKLSVTDLDQLDWYEQSEDMTAADLVARFRDKPPESVMLMGRDIHHILEHAQPGDTLEEAEGPSGYRFRFELQGENTLALPPTREMFLRRYYRIGGYQIKVGGKVDAIQGRRVWDHKITSRIDLERMQASMQWRFYLMMAGCDEFTYNFFLRKGKGDNPVVIRDIQRLNLYRYPGMEADIARRVKDFIAFAEQHLPERFTEDVEHYNLAEIA